MAGVGAILALPRNLLQHCIQLVLQLSVGEADHSITLQHQPLRALGIVLFPVRMAMAIDLHY